MDEKKIEEVMALVSDVACAAIAYGEAENGVILRNCLSELRRAEDAVETKLRQLLGEQHG